MKFTFACKKISLNDSIKEYAEKKISKLDKYFPEEADAFVTFAVEKKNRCVVELTIRAANGTLFRAQEEDPDGDMRGAIDEAVAFIDRRIRKNKTRLARRLRQDAFVRTPDETSFAPEEPEEGTFELVRTKKFNMKPMTREEAIRDIKDHPVYALDQQLDMFKQSYGTSELREWLHDIVSFQNETGELDRRDLARLERLHYVTDIYLKAVKAPAKK